MSAAHLITEIDMNMYTETMSIKDMFADFAAGGLLNNQNI